MIGWFYLVANHMLSESQPLRFLYSRQVVVSANLFSAKSPFVKLSVRQNFSSTKCPSAKCPFGKMSLGKVSFSKLYVFRQNVRPPKIASIKGRIAELCLDFILLSAVTVFVSSIYIISLAWHIYLDFFTI